MTKTSSQSQQEAGAAGTQSETTPFTIGMDTWAKWSRDGMARMQALADELAAAEAKGYERARAAADDLARMVGDTFAYAASLGAEWRRLTLETIRRGTDFVVNA